MRRRARELLSDAGLEESILCEKSYRTLRRGGWIEFNEDNGKRIAFSLSGLATLRLFCSSFESGEENTSLNSIGTIESSNLYNSLKNI